MPTTERMYADWRTRWALTRQQVASAVEWTTAALRRKQAARTLVALGWPCAIQDEATPLAPKPGGAKPRSPALKSEVRSPEKQDKRRRDRRPGATSEGTIRN